MQTAVLVGVAGSNNAFSLSLYNLKAYALGDKGIRRNWSLPVIQYPLIHHANYEFKMRELAEVILGYQPDLVAFSCYMWNIKFFELLGRYLKQQIPQILIVVGGPELDTEHIKEGNFDSFPADFCVSGEGEATFLDLIRYLSVGTPELDSIYGLSFRAGLDHPFITNNKRKPFGSLLSIPSPFLNGVVDEEVLVRTGVEANIETQRGCSLKCSYCIYHKDMPRISYAEIGRTIEEIRYVTGRGVKRLRFVDANFSSKLDHAKEVMRRMIAERFQTRLMVELIPGFIDEELAALFAEFNAISDDNEMTLGVGVQTINIEVLRKMRRGIRLSAFERTFELLKQYDIFAKIDLIIGLPGEDILSIERTLEYMIEELRGSHSHLLCCHTMRGLPGTELLDIAKEYHMEFTSEFEPHELYESPILPRADMLKCLRRTTVIFRLVNHIGWTDREFIFDQRSESQSIRDAFFETRDMLGISNVAQIDMIIDGLIEHLDEDSPFVNERFPYAETWWWNESKMAISNTWILSFLSQLRNDHVNVSA